MNGTTKDRKAKTEVERCYTKRREGERSTDRRSSRTENLENENVIRRPHHREKAEEENKMIHKKYGKSRRKRRLCDREIHTCLLVRGPCITATDTMTLAPETDVVDSAIKKTGQCHVPEIGDN